MVAQLSARTLSVIAAQDSLANCPIPKPHMRRRATQWLNQTQCNHSLPLPSPLRGALLSHRAPPTAPPTCARVCSGHAAWHEACSCFDRYGPPSPRSRWRCTVCSPNFSGSALCRTAATSSLRCRCVGPSRASAVNQSERRRHSCWRDRVGTRPSSSTTRKCGAILCTSSQTSGSFCPRCLLRRRVGLHTISPGIPRRVGYRVTASRVRVPQRESWRGSPP